MNQACINDMHKLNELFTLRWSMEVKSFTNWIINDEVFSYNERTLNPHVNYSMLVDTQIDSTEWINNLY
jgi:hypothetical protein